MELIAELLPLAEEGLAAIAVSAQERERYLGTIERRLARRCSGAIWQQRMLVGLRQQMPRGEALHALLEHYHENSLAAAPVAEWPL